METDHPTARERASTVRQNTLGDIPEENVPQIGPGFPVDDVPLPAMPAGIPQNTQRHAAIVVMAIARGAIPEDLVPEPSAAVQGFFDSDELEREEALALVAILAEVLAA